MSRLDLKVGDKARVRPADRSIVPTGWTMPWLYGLVAGFCSADDGEEHPILKLCTMTEAVAGIYFADTRKERVEKVLHPFSEN